MIHEHLKAHAVWLDEASYQVELEENVGFDANKAFADGDGLDAEWMGPVWADVFRRKFAGAGLIVKPGDAVLDVCCGQGFLTEYLLGLGAAVTSTDLSSAQLSSFAQRVGTGYVNACFARADLLKLPFPDASFDLVIGNSFLHHLPDVPAAAREMGRVLRPGGRLVMLHEPSTTANWWETFPLSLLKDTTYNSGFTDLWQFEPSELARLLERGGFSDVSIKGSGILACVICNWYLIGASKCGVSSKAYVAPALRLRAVLNHIELALGGSPQMRFPSLTICATK